MNSLKVIISIASAFFIIIFCTGSYGYSQDDKIQDKFITSPPQANYPTPYPLHRAELSAFLSALREAGLGGLFKGTGPFTGFIPTNDAIDKLGKGKWDELLKPENKDKLADILTYHMVPGKYKTDSLKSERMQTINGKYLNITVENNEIKVNNAKVIQANLEGPNWIVHEIDTVLIP